MQLVVALQVEHLVLDVEVADLRVGQPLRAAVLLADRVGIPTDVELGVAAQVVDERHDRRIVRPVHHRPAEPADLLVGGGDGWLLDGDLTIGDVTRPQRFELEFGGIEHFPGGARHAGFEATGELRRKEFGIDLAMPPGVSAVALGDVVKIELDIQLIEPEGVTKR